MKRPDLLKVMFYLIGYNFVIFSLEEKILKTLFVKRLIWWVFSLHYSLLSQIFNEQSNFQLTARIDILRQPTLFTVSFLFLHLILGFFLDIRHVLVDIVFLLVCFRYFWISDEKNIIFFNMIF